MEKLNENTTVRALEDPSIIKNGEGRAWVMTREHSGNTVKRQMYAGSVNNMIPFLQKKKKFKV